MLRGQGGHHRPQPQTRTLRPEEPARGPGATPEALGREPGSMGFQSLRLSHWPHWLQNQVQLRGPLGHPAALLPGRTVTRGESGSDQAERIHSESSWETEGPGYGEGKRGKKKLPGDKTNKQTDKNGNFSHEAGGTRGGGHTIRPAEQPDLGPRGKPGARATRCQLRGKPLGPHGVPELRSPGRPTLP